MFISPVVNDYILESIMKITHYRWIILIALGFSMNAAAINGEQINICGDGAGWPPYTYELNNEVLGYDIDVLEKILPPAGATFSVAMIPWARCLQQTQDGEFQIALSASFNEERGRTYIYTDQYYTVQPHYIYDSKRFPDGLNVSQASDLLNYRACGLRGYNYATFGVDSESVDRETSTFSQVVQKTLAGRCDLFLARYEIIAGFSALGEHHIRDGLVAEPIPGIDPDIFYMMISRAYPKANELVEVLNAGFESLRADGTLDAILDRYLGN